MRLSYTQNGSGPEIIEENNFYPFGMKREGYNALAGNPAYNYGYNGKELQKETGWSDYGARMYMSDIGRWGVIDPLAETSRRFSPYNYALNNPVSFIDPDGRRAMTPFMGDSFMQNANSGWFGGDPIGDRDKFLTANHSGSIGGPKTFGQTREFANIMATAASPGPAKNNFWDFLKGIFGDNKGAGIKTIVPGATIYRPGIQVGEAVFEGVLPNLSFDALLAGVTRAGLWSLPLILEGDMPEKEQMITLYRGVSIEAKGAMYFYASQGIAIPRGYEQVTTTWGPHSDMEEHAGGDNFSIWTSWSSSKEKARDFATGTAMYEKGIPGIIMSKTFRASEVVPNPYNTPESEWLIPGVVYGAKVEYVLPRK